MFLWSFCSFTNVLKPRSRFDKEENATIKTIKNQLPCANATILCGIKIGKYAFIGAGAVVTKDVPDFSLFVGNPGRVIGWVDKKEVGSILMIKILVNGKYFFKNDIVEEI